MGYRLHEAWEMEFSRDEVKRELRKHGAEWCEFVAEYGDKAEYAGSDVLLFLGY